MPYFPLPDEFHSAPEFLGASDAAVALYAKAASWSACHLTDGHVPTAALPMLTASHEQGSAELVERKVWRRARGGFQFVTWPREATRSNVEAQREANKRRQENYRRSQGKVSRRDKHVSNGVTHGVTNGVTNTAHTTPLHTKSSPDGEHPHNPQDANDEPPEFVEFYREYPRHKARQAARKAWSKAVKGGADPQTLIDGAKRYRAEREGQDPKFTKHPATWLNQGCWNDEPDERPLRLVSSDYRPWTNPADQSEYDEPLLPSSPSDAEVARRDALYAEAL